MSISDDISDTYMGYPEQSREAVRKTLALFNRPVDELPKGALVIIAGGNRCGKSQLIRPQQASNKLTEGEIVTKLRESGVEPLFYNDPKSAITDLGDNALGKLVILPDEYATAMMNDVKEHNGHVTQLGEFKDVLDLKDKGAKVIICLGMHSTIVTSPADLDKDGLPIYERETKKLTAIAERLRKEPDTLLLHLERDPKRTFDAIKKVARSDEYRKRAETTIAQRDAYLEEHFEFPGDDRASLRGECFGRSLPMNTDGALITRLLELLGTESANGEWSKTAEREARELFDKDYFKPFDFGQNDLDKPKRGAAVAA